MYILSNVMLCIVLLANSSYSLSNSIVLPMFYILPYRYIQIYTSNMSYTLSITKYLVFSIYHIDIQYVIYCTNMYTNVILCSYVIYLLTFTNTIMEGTVNTKETRQDQARISFLFLSVVEYIIMVWDEVRIGYYVLSPSVLRGGLIL